MSSFLYNSILSRPPVLIANRTEQFTCAVCGKPGWGAPNAKVHPGACRRRHTLQLIARRKQRRLATV